MLIFPLKPQCAGFVTALDTRSMGLKAQFEFILPHSVLYIQKEKRKNPESVWQPNLNSCSHQCHIDVISETCFTTCKQCFAFKPNTRLYVSIYKLKAFLNAAISAFIVVRLVNGGAVDFNVMFI